MVRINLLPHRAEKRAQRRRDFYVLVALAFGAAVVAVIAVAFVINTYIGVQTDRNTFIKAENKKLDEQIKEIASLRQDLEALKARQQAVEDLQADRNLPVHMLDELVKQVPEGVYLQTLRQDNLKVALTGFAQSNERVSELLRHLSNNSAWIGSPELVEIKAVTVGRDNKRLFQFTINVTINRPRDAKPAAIPARAAAAGNPAVPAKP
ncbi:MAG: PilN domain-containing protein [Burkholderiaceae bacterium]